LNPIKRCCFEEFATLINPEDLDNGNTKEDDGMRISSEFKIVKFNNDFKYIRYIPENRL